MTATTPETDWIDFVSVSHDPDTHEPVAILILDTEERPAVELTPDTARDLARKLTDLADEFEHHKPLRRLAAVGDQLRGLDD